MSLVNIPFVIAKLWLALTPREPFDYGDGTFFYRFSSWFFFTSGFFHACRSVTLYIGYKRLQCAGEANRAMVLRQQSLERHMKGTLLHGYLPGMAVGFVIEIFKQIIYLTGLTSRYEAARLVAFFYASITTLYFFIIVAIAIKVSLKVRSLRLKNHRRANGDTSQLVVALHGGRIRLMRSGRGYSFLFSPGSRVGESSSDNPRTGGETATTAGTTEETAAATVETAGEMESAGMTFQPSIVSTVSTGVAAGTSSAGPACNHGSNNHAEGAQQGNSDDHTRMGVSLISNGNFGYEDNKVGYTAP